MPRGGSRKHAPDCKCGNCPKLGRKKTERLSNPNVSEKVLRDMRHELLLKALCTIEMKRLGIDLSKPDFGAADAPKNVSIIPLTNLIDRLTCHAYGNPRDTVNHLHDKPIEHHVTHTLSERFRIALEKAEKRVSGRS